MVYDTQYACQDLKDDLPTGIKSTALLFGKRVRQVLAFFASVFLLCMVMTGYCNNHTAIYYVVACGGAALHFVWQLYTWRVDDPADCNRKFKVCFDHIRLEDFSHPFVFSRMGTWDSLSGSDYSLTTATKCTIFRILVAYSYHVAIE